MKAADREKLRALYAQLEQIQGEIEALLSAEQKQYKLIPRHTDAWQEAELTVDSLAYAVDDLDSVLGNLEELVEQ